MIIEKQNMLDIIRAALNTVDILLVDHGARVSYIVEAISREIGADERRILDYSILGLLHDIGAYKTEDIDRSLSFDSKNVWEHSIYGYLFIKYVSPLSDIAEGVKYHHLRYSLFDNSISKSCRDIAQIIHLADIVDIALQSGKSQREICEILNSGSGSHFNPEFVQAFLSALQKHDILTHIADNSYTKQGRLSLHLISNDDIKAYLYMLALTIDFHSEFTVLHNISVLSLSRKLAELMGLSAEETEKISIGALLHDIGKIAIPISILEKPARLTESEMDLMREHVVFSEKIISPYIAEDICKIAVRHHERLDGSGYPYGLTASELSLSEQIVAVADVTSALYSPRSYKAAFETNMILKELKLLSDSKKLSSRVISTLCERYHEVEIELIGAAAQTSAMYEGIQQSYKTDLKNFEKGIYFK